MPDWLKADLLVAIHVTYVGFVVLAVPVIMVGGVLRWNFVRNSWFRNIHVIMIGIVVCESIVGIPCPLTVWEKDYRAAAGQAGIQGSFIGHWLHELLFVSLDQWILDVAYCAFGALVVALYFLIRPRWLDRFSRTAVA